MRERRARLSEKEQARCAGAVSARVLACGTYAHARVVMAYMAARGELSLEAVIGDVLASGRALALPRCEGEGVMTARRVFRLDELIPGAYGIREPGRGCPEIAPEEIGLILVPGTAFDRSGARLGQGGGYYDRFLPRTAGVRMGVCHDFALLSSVPQQTHDQRMDAVVTPSGLIVCPALRG